MTGDRCGSRFGYRDHERDGSDKCRPCIDAQSAWARDYEKRRYLAGGALLMDGTGSRRRLRALAALGWPRRILAERMGITPSYAGALMDADRVQPATAARVAAVYDGLSMTLGPSPRSVAAARRKGWLPPLAYDDATIDDPAASPASTRDVDTVDELAVEAVLEGVRLQLAGATAHAAVHALHARGVPAAVVAERIGIQERQVERLKARDTAPHRKVNNYLGETA